LGDTYTMDLWPPHLFAATFLAQAAMAALSALVLFGVRLPMPTAAEIAGGRPIGAVARQPRFITAVLCGVVSYMLMNFIMTAAPLAMRLCGLSQEVQPRPAVARDRDVRPELLHRAADRALRRPSRGGRRLGIDRRIRRGRPGGSGCTAYGWDTVLWVSLFPLAVAVAALAATASSRPGRTVG
jgi:hypothetical protein